MDENELKKIDKNIEIGAKLYEASHDFDIEKSEESEKKQENVPDFSKNSISKSSISGEKSEKDELSKILDLNENSEDSTKIPAPEYSINVNLLFKNKISLLPTLIQDTKIDKQKVEFAEKLLFMRDLNDPKSFYTVIKANSLPEEDLLECEKLHKKFLELSKKYDKTIDELVIKIGQVSGDFLDLEKYLRGEAVDLWNELEDIVLKHPENQDMYTYLMSTKGSKSLEKRKKYLGLL